MIADLDQDGSGKIEFEEFLNLMTARISDKDSKEDIEVNHFFIILKRKSLDYLMMKKQEQYL
jgi:Ca2+-binding EF-hand superfamily protein